MPPGPLPALALYGGKVVTLDGADSIAQAVLIRGNRIAAVGRTAEVLAATDLTAVRLDLRGRTVVPGLIDGHAHMDREGLKSALPTLAGCRGIDDVLERIAALARAARPGQWIVTMPIGEPPDYRGVPEALREGRWPTRHDLDRAAPDNPVYIKSIWGYWRHSLPLVSIANSMALRLAGVGRGTLSPSPHLTIERDASGAPTGVFIETAYMPLAEFTLMAAAPGFTPAQRIEGLERSMAVYAGFGTTGVFEGHGVATEVIAAYRHLRASDRQRVRAHLVFSPAWGAAEGAERLALVRSWLSWLAGRGLGDGWLRVAGLYGEAGEDSDNRLRAGALPRLGTGWAGFNYDSGLHRSALRDVLIEAARNGVRAVGIWPDMLDLFAEVDRVAPITGQRWVYGHVSTADADAVARIRDLGLAVTTHTNRYIYKEGAALAARLGPEREDEVVPLRRLLDAGVPVSLATDNVPPSLFPPLWHAASRRTREGGTVAPAQALTRLEALRCASTHGAWLVGEEAERGSIEPGKLADLAMLSDDPLTVDEDSLPAITAVLTLVDGRVVHRTPGSCPTFPPLHRSPP